MFSHGAPFVACLLLCAGLVCHCFCRNAAVVLKVLFLLHLACRGHLCSWLASSSMCLCSPKSMMCTCKVLHLMLRTFGCRTFAFLSFARVLDWIWSLRNMKWGMLATVHMVIISQRAWASSSLSLRRVLCGWPALVGRRFLCVCAFDGFLL